MVGIYLLVYVARVPWWVYLLVYMSGYTTLGTPCILPSQPVYRAPLRQSAVRPGVPREGPGL